MQVFQPRKIYLDTCCLNRLFDSQVQERIRRETKVIETILSQFYMNHWYWIASSVLRFEIQQNPDLKLRSDLIILLQQAHQTIFVSGKEISRGAQLEALGFKKLDALHIACAESGEVDIFLTTDDKLLRRAIRLWDKLRVRVENPHTWLQ